MTRFSMLAAAGLVTLMSSFPAAAGGEMSQAELRRLFPGSFMAIVNGFIEVKITARGNGTLIGKAQGQKDTGRWSVRGRNLCIAWSRWMDGKVQCTSVTNDDGWYRGNGVKFKKI